MKYTTLRALEKHLESAALSQFADFYMVLAKDEGERKMATDSLLKYLVKGKTGFALKSFQGDLKCDDELLRELDTFSFLASKQVLMVYNADSLKKPTQQKLEDYFAHPNASVCLVLSAASISANSNFYKKAEKFGIILDVVEEKAWEKEKSLADWLMQTVQSQGKSMTQQSVQKMLKQVGLDQPTLSQELEKLICYVGDRKDISPADVEAICTTFTHDNTWQLGEALFKRDAAAALRISRGLVAEGTPFLALVRQIRSQFQTEYQVCCLLSQGGGAQEVAKAFPYMRGMILDRHMQMAASYGLTRFRQAMLHIDSHELLAKNGVDDHDLLLDILINKLTV